MRWHEEGGEYVGSWRNSQPHGSGRYVWANGEAYEGEWYKGLRMGTGRQVWPDGGCYSGCWLEGEASGPGRHVFGDGSEYIGEWSGGKCHGEGKWEWQDGSRYQGQWTEDQRHGKGLMKWHDGASYEGFWKWVSHTHTQTTHAHYCDFVMIPSRAKGGEKGDRYGPAPEGRGTKASGREACGMGLGQCGGRMEGSTRGGGMRGPARRQTSTVPHY